MDYDDYGDDYDDYDDEDYEDYDQQQYAAPPKQKVAPPKPTVALQIAVAGKPAMAAVGITKPPAGWGKSNPNAHAASAPAPAAAKGVAKPPPGWGKPEAPASAAAGISKAPPGWGKPETTTSTTTTSSSATKLGATQKTPPRKQGGGSSDTSTSISNQVSSKQPFKPLPEVLKNTRSQLSMVVLGHVDAGKSTLMGQLLVQVGQVNKRTAEKQQLAWLLDEDEGERAHGVTMQIATKSFTTPSHDIIILDAPGHADFIPIMITGAAHADVAILVVAATRGEFESGFERGGQTKEHVILARGLGVSQVIVAINKLDVDDWKHDRYQEVQQRIQEYLVQQQFKPARIRFVPLSGLTGENVKDCKDETLKSWYKGPTLLEAIDGFQAANRHVGESHVLVCVCVNCLSVIGILLTSSSTISHRKTPAICGDGRLPGRKRCGRARTSCPGLFRSWRASRSSAHWGCHDGVQVGSFATPCGQRRASSDRASGGYRRSCLEWH
jgi:signal recognition particle receptor subunit beta